MKNTRFMDRLFSAMDEKDEELAAEVAQDIESANAGDAIETDELKYEGDGDGRVMITDKENGEVTVAEPAEGEDGTFDLYPVEQLEGYLHLEEDGVTPSAQEGVEMEDVSADHLDGEEISDQDPSCLEDRQFSVSTDNVVVQYIFSEQEFCDRLFSEVIESEETAIIGDLKIEKDPEDECSVIVTSESTGDQAKVVLEDDEMEVTELESKNFSNEEQYMPLHLVGVEPVDHVIVDAPVYTNEDAQELAALLGEQGVEAIQVFETPEEARDYAIELLNGLGGNIEVEGAIEEPVQSEFSEYELYLTKFYSSNTAFMDKLFSEAVNDVDASQNAIEDAIESGDEIEVDGEIITPIDANSAIVEDKGNGEFSKVVLNGRDMEVDAISEEEAAELTDHLYSDGTEYDEETCFSDIYCNEAETRFFSENEDMTEYMVRLYSEEANQDEIEDAIESGEQIENETEIITPIDANSAIVEDKENGEFTKAVIEGDGIEVTPISESEADHLTEGLAVAEEEEKEFSDIYCNEAETRFFSENEEMTNYMVRLFSEEADQDEIEKAIESGEEVETEKEVISPISDTEAIIEDKESGEFTKAVIDGENMEVTPLSEEEADALEEGAEEDEVSAEEKGFSDNDMLGRFFSEMQPTEGEEEEDKPTVEVIEDKAMAAIQSIQEMAEQAAGAIQEAKEAPVEQEEGDLKEAQFSEDAQVAPETPVVSWLRDTNC